MFRCASFWLSVSNLFVSIRGERFRQRLSDLAVPYHVRDRSWRVLARSISYWRCEADNRCDSGLRIYRLNPAIPLEEWQTYWEFQAAEHVAPITIVMTRQFDMMTPTQFPKAQPAIRGGEVRRPESKVAGNARSHPRRSPRPLRFSF